MQREAKKREHEQGLLERRPETMERDIRKHNIRDDRREHDHRDDRREHIPRDVREHEQRHRESRYHEYRPDQYEDEFFGHIRSLPRRHSEYPQRHR